MNKELLHKLMSLSKALPKYTSLTYSPMSEFVCYVTPKETVHSQIISELLNPKGKHGYADRYLAAFFKTFIPHLNYGDFKDFNVIRERKVARVLTQGRVRFIDILINYNDHCGCPHAIIIENKLNNAKYQNLQIEDYSAGLARENIIIDAVIIMHDHYQHPVTNKYASEITLYPKHIAEWIESVNPDDYNIRAYTDYLMLLHNQNILYENSIKMLDLSLEELKELYELKVAFDNLNATINDYITEQVRLELQSLDLSIESSFSKLDEGCYALQLWNQADYDKTGLWVALFAPQNPINDENGTDVYLYTHDRKSSNETIANHLGYEKQGSMDGYTYFKAPGAKSRFTFFDKESRQQLIDEIVRLLTELHKFQIAELTK